MGLFDNALQGGQTIIRNEMALDYEFLPKLLPFRENEQQYLATCIKPLFQNRSGRNVLVFGAPGIGKTAAIRSVIKELEEETDDIHVVYLNCWQHNTTYKILLEICSQVGYRFTQNKNTTELIKVIASICNKSAAVFAFDEIDKVEDFDFLYTLLEEIFRKSVILITNYKSWLMELDERIKSRLTPELLEFRQYSPNETKEILRQRLDLAFIPQAWEPAAFDIVAIKAGDIKDVRAGLFLMKNAATEAETKSSRTVQMAHVQIAISRMDNFFVKHQEELEDETRKILDVVSANSGKRIGDLHQTYLKAGGTCSYKTFQRKIARLEQNRFISTEKSGGGAGGNTTIVNKRISDF